MGARSDFGIPIIGATLRWIHFRFTHSNRSSVFCHCNLLYFLSAWSRRIWHHERRVLRCLMRRPLFKHILIPLHSKRRSIQFQMLINFLNFGESVKETVRVRDILGGRLRRLCHPFGQEPVVVNAQISTVLMKSVIHLSHRVVRPTGSFRTSWILNWVSHSAQASFVS